MSSSEQIGGVSRPSMTNRADADIRRYGPQRGETLKTPLTGRQEIKLRSETIEYELGGNVPLTWRQTTQEWREWFEDRRQAALVWENEEGDRCTGPQETRFHPSYSSRLYAKMKDLERGLHREYGRRFQTALLTLTASSTPEGRPLPPVDHLDALLSSWEAVRRSLDRALEGRRWERLAVLEPHKSGYAHIHIAVFVAASTDRRPVDQGTFQPVIDAHLRNCPIAGEDAHDGPSITVKTAGEDAHRGEGVIGNLGSYLGEYLGIYEGDPLNAPDHVQMFNALLWATGRQRWRPSQGAQELMAYEPPEASGEWELLGVTTDGGATIDPINPHGGGVEWATTFSIDRPPPGTEQLDLGGLYAGG